MDRKADLETEGFRAWVKDEKPFTDEGGIKISLADGTEMSLMGFTTAREKGTDKLIFAYKIKAHSCLFYIPKDLDEETKKMVDEALDGLKGLMPMLEFRDIEKLANEIHENESGTLERISKLKKEKKKNGNG